MCSLVNHAADTEKKQTKLVFFLNLYTCFPLNQTVAKKTHTILEQTSRLQYD